MTWRILVAPSGRRYRAEPHETLLEAGLRAGLALPHRCSNGSCGECKARVLSGKVVGAGFFDYRLSETEQALGYVLTCRVAAASDLTIEIREADAPVDIPEQRLAARVAKLQRPREDIMIVHMRTPRSQALQFLAGQQVMLTFAGSSPTPLPIASCPCDGVHLQFHLRDCPDQPAARYAFSALRAGERVDLRGPFGDFTFDEGSERPALFVAYESGFGQIKSLIEHALSLDVERAISLYWISATESGPYMSNYCRSWEDALDHFRYMPLVLSTGTDGFAARLGRTLSPLWRERPDIGEHDVYAAVPASARDRIRALFLALGLPPRRLRVAAVGC